MSAAPQPAASRRTELTLRVSAFLLAGLSLAALLAHVFGVLPMPYFLTVFGVPSLLLLFALAALGRRINARVFTRALVTGLWAGLIATFFYDGVRFVIAQTHLFGYSGFVPILMFGSWITGMEPSSLPAKIAGWGYHYWNGITFGIMYALTFPARHWLFGVGYAILMEMCMLGIFPMFLRVSNKVDFIAVSMIGHVFYGAVLGILVQRYTLQR
ncbi:MAG: hypothetical protein ACRD3A_02865 [Terriglobales bacterium]